MLHMTHHHASRFIFSSFFFNFSICFVWWTELATRQLSTACYILLQKSYKHRIKERKEKKTSGMQHYQPNC